MWFTLPLDVIWKHNMGERRWTFLRLVAHTFVIQFAVFYLILLAFPDQLVPKPGQDDHVQTRQAFALYGFILLMWIFGLANLWEIRKRTKAGIQWHTYYWGEPRFLPDKPFVRGLIIPLGSGLIAYGFFRVSHPVGIYLFSMAALQFLDTTDTYRDRRNEKLNRRDREIDMEIKTAELEDGYREPLEIVRVAKPASRARRAEEAEQFEARWKNVLKSDSQN